MNIVVLLKVVPDVVEELEIAPCWSELDTEFEQFCIGRPAEEMPQITSRICGVCPTAHHMASVKALDQVFHAGPPPGRFANSCTAPSFWKITRFISISWVGRISSSVPMHRPGSETSSE